MLIVGASGSGKTTLANELCERYNWSQVHSYTTRAPRFESEKGHTFVADDEFDKLTDFVGYTEYNGSRYGATEEQASNCELYVIDIDGVRYFADHYHGDKKIVVAYIVTPEPLRYTRMVERGDSELVAAQRINNDRLIFPFTNSEITAMLSLRDGMTVGVIDGSFSVTQVADSVSSLILKTLLHN